jgi:hypothetical protein
MPTSATYEPLRDCISAATPPRGARRNASGSVRNRRRLIGALDMANGFAYSSSRPRPKLGHSQCDLLP